MQSGGWPTIHSADMKYTRPGDNGQSSTNIGPELPSTADFKQYMSTSRQGGQVHHAKAIAYKCIFEESALNVCLMLILKTVTSTHLPLHSSNGIDPRRAWKSNSSTGKHLGTIAWTFFRIVSVSIRIEYTPKIQKLECGSNRTAYWKCLKHVNRPIINHSVIMQNEMSRSAELT